MHTIGNKVIDECYILSEYGCIIGIVTKPTSGTWDYGV